MAELSYRVALSSDEIQDRLRAASGDLFHGSVGDSKFSLQRCRLFMEMTGRVMQGVIEQTGPQESVIHITFRSSPWTRFTIAGYFFSLLGMQLLFLPFIVIGIRDAQLRGILVGLIPLLFLAIGYGAYRSGIWTHPWSEADLLRSLDTVLGDAKL